jgi:hypothetical protein
MMPSLTRGYDDDCRSFVRPPADPEVAENFLQPLDFQPPGFHHPTVTVTDDGAPKVGGAETLNGAVTGVPIDAPVESSASTDATYEPGATDENETDSLELFSFVTTVVPSASKIV